MKGKKSMRKSLGFTLAEVLITLAIIGVVAAMTIPSVIVNTNQQEFKTGLKKAVSVLNQAITMSIALENMGPNDVQGDNKNLRNFFQQRLNVIKVTDNLDYGSGKNAAFYTADGMRFEFPATPTLQGADINTNNTVCGDGKTKKLGTDSIAKPCLILVDVNGDKKPNPDPNNVSTYSYPKSTSEGRITDVFTVMITDTAAIPAGTVAQKTMFQAD